jgi:acyl carrier protein
MSDVRDRLQELFREVFGDDGIVLEDGTGAGEIAGWDSLMHINLVIAMEQRFGVKFTTAEIAGMKAPGQTIGGLVRVIRDKQAG